MKIFFLFTTSLLITTSVYSDSKHPDNEDIQRYKLEKAEAYIDALKKDNEKFRKKYQEQQKDNSDKELLKSLLTSAVIFIVLLLFTLITLYSKLKKTRKEIDGREEENGLD